VGLSDSRHRGELIFSVKKIILCLALVLSGGLVGCSTNDRRGDEIITNVVIPMKLKTEGSWENLTVKFISLDSTGSPVGKNKIEEVSAKQATYKLLPKPASPDSEFVDEHSVLAIHDPYRKRNCIIERCQFYVSDKSGLTGYDVGDDLMWNTSYLEMSDAEGDLDAAITKFESRFDTKKLEEKYLERDLNRVRMRGATSNGFFGQGGPAYGPKLDAVDVTKGIMRLDMTSGADNKIKASVWINLKTKKAIRTIENGVEMNLNSGWPNAIPKGAPVYAPVIIALDPATGLPVQTNAYKHQ
jgi:hypothetical protein